MTSIIPRLPYLWEEICGTAPAPTPAPGPGPHPVGIQALWCERVTP